KGRTTAFTCRAGCKERDVAENRNAGPVKCNFWFAGARSRETRRPLSPNQLMPVVEGPTQQLVHPRAHRIACRLQRNQVYGAWFGRLQARKLLPMNGQDWRLISGAPERE